MYRAFEASKLPLASICNGSRRAGGRQNNGSVRQRLYPANTGLLDREFKVLTRSEIEPNQPRDHQICSTELFANPILRDDLLIYATDCGAIRLHDLKEMRQIAARPPADSSRFPSFEIWNGELLAFGPDDDRSGLIIDQVAIPTLQLTHTQRACPVSASPPPVQTSTSSRRAICQYPHTPRQ
jgi:hypothetical protein